MLPIKELEWYLQAAQLYMWEDSGSLGANSLPESEIHLYILFFF